MIVKISTDMQFGDQIFKHIVRRIIFYCFFCNCYGLLVNPKMGVHFKFESKLSNN